MYCSLGLDLLFLWSFGAHIWLAKEFGTSKYFFSTYLRFINRHWLFLPTIYVFCIWVVVVCRLNIVLICSIIMNGALIVEWFLFLYDKFVSGETFFSSICVVFFWYAVSLVFVSCFTKFRFCSEVMVFFYSIV